MKHTSCSPCPFCGSDDVIPIGLTATAGDRAIAVRCNACHAVGPPAINADTPSRTTTIPATSKWNHRVTTRAARRAAAATPATTPTPADNKTSRLLSQYAAGMWDAEALPNMALSTSEHLAIAIAIDRHDLMPSGWGDPLTAYKNRLDDRQRHLVDSYRGWKT